MRFNYDKTFKIMEARRLTRTLEGTINSNDTKSFVLLISFSIFLYGLSNIVWENNSPIPSNYDLKTNIAILILGIVLFSISYIQTTLKYIVPILSFGFFISISVSIFHSVNKNVNKNYANFVTTVGITCLLVIQYISKVIRKTLYKILGKLVYLLNNIDYWFSIHNDGDFYIYNNIFYLYRKRYKKHFSYDGQLNELGRPHGYGTWYGMGYNAEELTGMWKDGIPIGPFVSTIYPHGYITSSVQVCYVKNREEPINEYWFSSRYDPHGLQWGICNVECSAAGKFYRHLPCVTIESIGYKKTAEWCIKHIKNIKKVNKELVITKNSEHIFVNGINTQKNEVKINIDDPLFHNVKEKKEAAIFLHGFNTALETMLERIGQLWTLGNLSEHIVPFVHSWPTSKSYCYFRALRRAWDSTTVYDLVELVKSIKKSGISNINIICHSMGVAMLIQLADFFPEIFDSESSFRLSSIIIINPDIKIETFKSGYLKNISKFCDFTTIYADESDNALWYSEFFNRYKVVGKNPFDVELRDLQVEIVDVSWMDTNMHDMRHSFFDINRSMIEDVSDILIRKQKASSRLRLVKREQNVWSFASAPKYIVNK